MAYFVTGATGFIGRYLVENLLKREGTIYVLCRESSLEKVEALRKKVGDLDGRVVPVTGDLTQPRLGLSDADLAKLEGNIKHFFHLAAIYDLAAGETEQVLTNIEGTRNAMNAAEAIGAGCFHHTSSIAAAGMYPGIFREDMFEEAEKLNDAYLRTKHESEGLVRKLCKVPFRIYRPAMVVGHSKTGEIDKIDGPYYFFTLIKKLRQLLPPWMPVVGIEGGRFNLVPVDYVADAMDHLAHQDGLNGKCFHLTDETHYKIGEVINIFARAGHAPQMTMRVDTRMFGFLPPFLRKTLSTLPPVRRITSTILEDLGIPRSVMKFTDYYTKFDNREARAALEGSGISCPKLDTYAWRLWDFWERNLDPDLFIDRSLEGRVADKVVVVTGASSGIGKATAIKLAEAGAIVIMAARKPTKLEKAKQEIEEKGGKVYSYSVDIADMEDCDRFAKQVLEDFGRVDVLINNAGRSIRRSINLSYDRFHDFERTMQLNYFGSLRLIMNFLPVMERNRSGHVINISSIGTLTMPARFSAYVASKSALDAFSRCAASEFSDCNVHFSTINMPLVRTPMIAPTKIYENVPTISPEEAADMVGEAIIYRSKRIATKLGVFGQVVHAVAPKFAEIIINTGFRMFPDSAAAKGNSDESAPAPVVSPEQMAFAYLMRGVHW
ncbi:SDR family oxidoreductase [Ketobacter alkanivorans]|uniref:Short chain dehydrogenase n=1 Tax=Ketobacter alkanivorans TaxID=1917421 RepID=A0A2K9LP37_9GAMM|nr:SDR family oxidoreductase [Ketobacter alkanivorans]AUM13997.1 short chain dehydrogenase [Ketobacter alkanivorans]